MLKARPEEGLVVDRPLLKKNEKMLWQKFSISIFTMLYN